MTDTNELADSESNKANRLADLEPAAEVAPEESAFDSVAIVHSDLEPGTDLFTAEDIIQFLRELKHKDGTSNYGDAALENAAQKIEEQTQGQNEK